MGKVKKVISPLSKRKILSKVAQWFKDHALTVVSCTLITALGVVFLAWSSPGTTTIGENISTGNITASGNLEISGNATTTGNFKVSGLTNLATTTISGNATTTGNFKVSGLTDLATTTLWGNLDLNDNSINNVLGIDIKNWAPHAFYTITKDIDEGRYLVQNRHGKIVKIVDDPYKANVAFQYAYDNLPSGAQHALIWVTPVGVNNPYYMSDALRFDKATDGGFTFATSYRHGCSLRHATGYNGPLIVVNTDGLCSVIRGFEIMGKEDNTDVRIIEAPTAVRFLECFWRSDPKDTASGYYHVKNEDTDEGMYFWDSDVKYVYSETNVKYFSTHTKPGAYDGPGEHRDYGHGAYTLKSDGRLRGPSGMDIGTGLSLFRGRVASKDSIYLNVDDAPFVLGAYPDYSILYDSTADALQFRDTENKVDILFLLKNGGFNIPQESAYDSAPSSPSFGDVLLASPTWDPDGDGNGELVMYDGTAWQEVVDLPNYTS